MHERKAMEKRRYPRISWNFTIRFRPQGQKDIPWQTSTVKNIGEGGCFFYSDSKYPVGQELEIEVRDPVFEEVIRFCGRVERSDDEGVAVEFSEIDEEVKRNYIETIIFLLKREL